jgi:Domain of unknown function (DUF222)
MSDDAIVGLLQASRRPGWSAVSEHVAAELAAALTLTGRSADALLGLARDLARLPAVLRALLAGTIDRARAAVFAAELSALGDCAADAAANALLPAAPGMTTGQLRHALRALVQAIDPAAVRRRMAAARGGARVEGWQEGSGDRALAGRELSPAGQAAADRRITAIARALHDAGAPGTVDQLRAAVFTALLAGRDPGTLTPAPGPGLRGLAALSGSVHLTLPASTWLGLADLPGEAAGLGPLDAWTSRDLASTLAARAALARWCLTLTGPTAPPPRTPAPAPDPGRPPAPPPAAPGSPASRSPGWTRAAAPTAPRPPATGRPAPCATWSGPGTGPAPSPAAADPPNAATSTTPSPSTRAAGPACATWPRRECDNFTPCEVTVHPASRDAGASASVGVAPVADGVHLNLVFGLVDPVDDPVRAATGRVVAVEWLVERLACSVRADGDRSLDRLHSGGGHFKGQVLVDVAASLA